MFLQSSSNLGKICENGTPISFSRFIRDRYLFLITAMSEDPTSHKEDTVKGITIRAGILPKLGIRHSVKSKNLSDFLN